MPQGMPYGLPVVVDKPRPLWFVSTNRPPLFLGDTAYNTHFPLNLLLF